MIRTSADVRAEFQRKGVSIASWAVAHNFSTTLVFEVLAGRKKGIRGQSHKIAVMLGLKEGEVSDPKDIDYSRPATTAATGRKFGRRVSDQPTKQVAG